MSPFVASLSPHLFWDVDREQVDPEKHRGANEYIVLRSLTYFADAETQPLPRILAPFDWEKAKADIRAAVEELA